MIYTHPVKTLRINGKEVEVEYVEMRFTKDSDMDVLAFYRRPDGVLEGKMCHIRLDSMPLSEVKRHYPHAQVYNKFLSQEPGVDHLHDGSDMDEYERSCLKNEEGW